MPKTILIADDDANLVEVLAWALRDAGYATRSAATGQEAVEKAQRAPPDLVLLDLMLPGMNGFSVCQALREQAATASIPVIIITGMPGEFPRLTGVELGAVAYVQKPFSVPDLVARIGDCLRRPPSAVGPPACPPGASPPLLRKGPE